MPRWASLLVKNALAYSLIAALSSNGKKKKKG